MTRTICRILHCLAAFVLVGAAAFATGAPSVEAASPIPYDFTPGCSFPSNVIWQHCWGTPYSGPYTQAWIGPGENDAYGYHHNVHLQPAQEQGQDYMNLHVRWWGVNGLGKYSWVVYCSYAAAPYNGCQDWNNNSYGGAYITENPSDCSGGDGYPCAFAAAEQMAYCLYNAPWVPFPGVCSYHNQTWVQGAFPSIDQYLLQKDGIHNGTLPNAFCDVMNKASGGAVPKCSQH